jgi:hypothetical protein
MGFIGNEAKAARQAGAQEFQGSDADVGGY